jgi:hypothetical protein
LVRWGALDSQDRVLGLALTKGVGEQLSLYNKGQLRDGLQQLLQQAQGQLQGAKQQQQQRQQERAAGRSCMSQGCAAKAGKWSVCWFGVLGAGAVFWACSWPGCAELAQQGTAEGGSAAAAAAGEGQLQDTKQQQQQGQQQQQLAASRTKLHV